MTTEIIQPSRIIDIHTHLFNARCLPLAGIIANFIGKDAADSRFSRILGKILNKLCASESDRQLTEDSQLRILRYKANSEQAALEDLLDILETRLLMTANEAVESRTAHDTRLNLDVMSEAISRVASSELYGLLSELNAELEIIAPSGNVPASLTSVTDHVGWAKGVLKRAMEWLARKANELALLTDEIPDVITFIYRMLSSEHSLARALFKSYGADLPPLKVVHHLMDMQMGYTNNTPPQLVAPQYDFITTQLAQFSSLQTSQGFSGRVFGFAAFDPRRAYDNNIPAFVDTVKNDGYRGFKFYCAMGYKPIENNDAAVEANVNKFFDACESRKMRVFTHCTPNGFETRFKLGRNADPRNWNGRLARNPGLFLCFGHAGGDNSPHKNAQGRVDFRSPGWVATNLSEWNDQDNYAKAVVELCIQYPNVYCDLAYLTGLIEGLGAEQEKSFNIVKENLKRAAVMEGKFDFMTKVCYGSDWHMPSMVGHPRKYLDVFIRMFGDGDPDFKAVAKYREEFFWKNARTYLGIEWMA
jgi:hypothetical protein